MKRRFCLLLCCFAIFSFANAQNVWSEKENFDGNTISFSATPAKAWRVNTDYSVSSPNAYLGIVPNSMGDSTILTTPVYDLYTGGYSNVL